MIKAGEFKGLGFPGTPITDEQKAYLQELVDKTQRSFTAGVATGRGMAESAVPVTGRTYMAEDAQRLGLIDGIQTLDETLSALASAVFERRASEPPSTQQSAHTQPNSTMLRRKKAKPKVTTTSEGVDVTAERQSSIIHDAEPEKAEACMAEDTTAADTTAPDATAPDATASTSQDDASTTEVETAEASIAEAETAEGRIAALERELAEARAQADQAKTEADTLKAEQLQASFAAFAREHRGRTLPANESRVVAVMDALHAYDQAESPGAEDDSQASALEEFKAFIASLPVQYAAGLEVTGNSAATAEVPTVSVPADSSVDPARMEMAQRIKSYAQEHGLSYRDAMTQIGDAVLAGTHE